MNEEELKEHAEKVEMAMLQWDFRVQKGIDKMFADKGEVTYTDIHDIQDDAADAMSSEDYEMDWFYENIQNARIQALVEQLMKQSDKDKNEE